MDVKSAKWEFIFELEKQNKKIKMQQLPDAFIGLYISASALTWKLSDSPGRYSNVDTQAFCEEEKKTE